MTPLLVSRAFSWNNIIIMINQHHHEQLDVHWIIADVSRVPRMPHLAHDSIFFDSIYVAQV